MHEDQQAGRGPARDRAGQDRAGQGAREGRIEEVEGHGRGGSAGGSGRGRDRLAALSGGLAVAVLLLGFNSVYLAAASEPTLFYAWQVVLHPLLGLLAAVFFAAWWWHRRQDRGTLVAGLLLWGSAALGAVLPFAGGTGAVALVALHVGLAVAGVALLLWARHPSRTGAGRGAAWYPAAGLAALALAIPLVAWLADREPELPRAFTNPPAPLTMAGEAMGGEDGPFYPSALHTSGEGVLTALPPTSACGGAGCHDDVIAEWESSPHRWSGEDDPWYRASVSAFREEMGPVPARWCAGCHEPGRLAGGVLSGPDGGNGFAAGDAQPAVAPAGVSCVSCHGIQETLSTMGQAHHEVALTGLAGLAGGGPLERRVHDWATRLDPEAHARAWAPTSLTGPLSSETCASCHKSHLDEPVNGHRWFQDMNDYDQWQASHISGYGGRSFYRPEPRGCVDCHMPQRPDGKRSHRFAAASTSSALRSGDPGQLAAVEAMLGSGAVTVDLLAATVDGQTVAPLDGARLPAGSSPRVDVVVATPGMGHNFPGGKLDTADAWLELRAEGAGGEPIFWSGRLGEDGSVESSAHRYRLRLLDEGGRPVEHRDVWNARAEVYRSWILPLAAEVVRYRLELPEDVAGPVRLTARLHYRDFSPEFQGWVAERLAAEGDPEGADLPELPVLTVASDSVTFDVVPPGSPPAAPVAAREDWRRFNDYGIGLLLQGDVKGSRAAFTRVTELDPDYVDGWLNRGWISSIEGDLEAMEEALEKARALDPELARTLYFLGRLEQQRGDNEAAAALYRRAAEKYPYDRVIHVFLMQTQAALGHQEAVLEETDRLLAVDPEYSLAHYNAMLAHRALGNGEAAEHHQQLYERFRIDEAARALTGPYLETHPDDNRERQAIHEHPSGPLPGQGRDDGAPPGRAEEPPAPGAEGGQEE